MGVNRTYVGKLEKGTSYPGLEIIAELATVLEVEPGGVEGARVRRNERDPVKRLCLADIRLPQFPDKISRACSARRRNQRPIATRAIGRRI